MKRLLLMCAAATAIMLTACVDVSLAGSAQAANGGRVTLTTLVSSESSCANRAGSDAVGEARFQTADFQTAAMDASERPHADQNSERAQCGA